MRTLKWLLHLWSDGSGCAWKMSSVLIQWSHSFSTHLNWYRGTTKANMQNKPRQRLTSLHTLLLFPRHSHMQSMTASPCMKILKSSTSLSYCGVTGSVFHLANTPLCCEEEPPGRLSWFTCCTLPWEGSSWEETLSNGSQYRERERERAVGIRRRGGGEYRRKGCYVNIPNWRACCKTGTRFDSLYWIIELLIYETNIFIYNNINSK